MSKVNLFKNKFILLAVILACVVLILTLINEKTRTTFKLLPMFREVALNANNFVITTTMDGSPIIINKDDPHVNNLRICGKVHSLFNDALKLFLKEITG